MSESEAEIEEVRQWIAMGRMLLAEDRFDEALALIEKATSATSIPTVLQSRAWRLKSMVLFKIRRYEDALVASNRMIDLRPAAAAGYLQRATDLSALERHDEAIADCEKAIALEPENDIVWRYQGNILFQAGRYAQARSAYERAVALDPRDAKAFVGLAETLAAMGRQRAAIAACDQALQIMSVSEDAPRGSAWAKAEEVQVLQIKMHSLNRLKRWAGALQVSKQILILASTNSDAWSVKGVALHRLNRYDEALIAEERFVELQHEDLEGWKNLALTHLALRDASGALIAYNQAVAVDPDNRVTRRERASVVLAQLFMERTVQPESLPIDDPDLNDPEAWVAAANFLRYFRKPEAGLAVCNEGIQRYPTNADLYIQKTLALMDLRRFREMASACARGLGVAVSVAMNNRPALERQTREVQ
jgi:tetratricopeptide (TPR) repeat protein